MADNTKEKFSVIMQITVKSLIEMIKNSANISEDEAVKSLCSSKLYKALVNEETNLWHMNVPELFGLYMEEKSTGRITFPGEA